MNFKSDLHRFALLELRTVYLINDISLLRQITRAARCFKYFKGSNKSTKQTFSWYVTFHLSSRREEKETKKKRKKETYAQSEEIKRKKHRAINRQLLIDLIRLNVIRTVTGPKWLRE